MTYEEFYAEALAAAIEKRGMTKAEFDRRDIVLPCRCTDYEDCRGWILTTRGGIAEEIHRDNYGLQDWTEPRTTVS